MKLWGKDGFRLDNELDRNWLSWTILIWGAVCAWFVWNRFGQIHWLALGDTDDNMRLMQVRALLNGQGWYDLRQYRLDPAMGGYDIHWSRFVDLPIAGLILVLKPFIGPVMAERWACGLAPLIPLAIAMAALAATTRRLVSPVAWPLALIILMTCGTTLSMFMPERIDHHGWQLALLALTVAGLADTKGARGGAVVGLSSALSLVIGLEMLPYCAMAGAIVALRWIWDRGEVRRMLVYGLTLGGGSSIGFVIFASNADQAMRCDALTPVWLSVMVAAGAFLTALSLANPANRWARLGLGAAAGGAIVAGFALLFPQCLGRPEQASPELVHVWLNNVREARSILTQPLDTQVTMLAMPIIGLIGAIVATWRARRTPMAVGWAAIALFTAFALGMLVWQVRAGPAGQMLGVPGATWLVWTVVSWFLGRKLMLLRVFGAVGAFVLCSGLFVNFLPKLLPQPPAQKGPDRSGEANAACTRVTTLSMLNRIAPATMFTHVDLGPRLITITHHNGVAGPYHRNGRAILDVHYAFMGKPEQFRPIAKAHGADYLLICPNLAETTLYRARSPNGFYAQLAQGRVPKWLEPVTLPTGAPFRLWKIRYDLPG